jgi:hypothetical protein
MIFLVIMLSSTQDGLFYRDGLLYIPNGPM